jgi:hypothetical protein
VAINPNYLAMTVLAFIGGARSTFFRIWFSSYVPASLSVINHHL